MLLSAKRARMYHSHSWLSDPMLCAWIARHLSPYGKSICDVGAGDGNMSTYLATTFKAVTLLEPSSAMFRLLRRRIPHDSRGVRVIRCEAESIPLPTQSVDIALSKSSLHHFHDWTRALQEMKRIATRAVAVVEVISPQVVAGDPKCLEYLTSLLTRKEACRFHDSVFTEDELTRRVSQVSVRYRVLRFDQYIDVRTWLDNSDLRSKDRRELYTFVRSQPADVKTKMQIHYQHGRLVQLRPMLLVIGLLR
jgi:ubiquinone/menaquinone biosynthesis C-methylase UbiE